MQLACTKTDFYNIKLRRFSYWQKNGPIQDNNVSLKPQEFFSLSFNSVTYIFPAAQATHVHQGSSLRMSQFLIGF